MLMRHGQTDEQDVGLVLLSDLISYRCISPTAEAYPLTNQVTGIVDGTVVEGLFKAAMGVGEHSGRDSVLTDIDLEWELIEVGAEQDGEQEPFENVEWEEVVDAEIPDENLQLDGHAGGSRSWSD